MKKIKYLAILILFSIFATNCRKVNDFSVVENKQDRHNYADNKLSSLTSVLPNNTYLYPSGGSSSVLFKGGTSVTLDSYGKVLIGTIANNTYLYPAGGSSSSILFKAQTIVYFAAGEAGKVERGTLENNTYLYATGGSSSILFKANTEVFFGAGFAGRVRTGTLANNTYLYRSRGSSSILFSAGSVITFDNYGKVA